MYQAMQNISKNVKREVKADFTCPRPNCPEKRTPYEPYPGSCTCRGPWYIYIEPGTHIHIDCPVHGDVILHGSPIIWC